MIREIETSTRTDDNVVWTWQNGAGAAGPRLQETAADEPAAVIQLSGSTQGAGLTQLVRVLGDLGKSGCLRLTNGYWAGEMSFDRGEIIAASFGLERGLAALEAIVFALPRAEFTFTDSVVSMPREIELARRELETRLAATVAARATLPPALATPADVPRLAAPDSSGGPEAVRLDRSTMRTLLAVDGRRSIQEIAADRRLAQTVRELALLARAGLVCGDAPSESVPVELPVEAPQTTPRSGGLGRLLHDLFIRDIEMAGLDALERRSRRRTIAGLPWPFAIFLGGLGISALGDALYALALPWFAYELTRSPLIMGTLFATETVPILLFGPLIGVFVDRWDRRRLLLGSDLLRAGTVALIPVLYVTGQLQLVHLYVCAFALALITLAFNVGTTAAVPEIAGEDLTRANAAQQFVTQAASMAGPVVAGVVIALVGAVSTLWLDAISFGGTFLAVLLLPSFKVVSSRTGSASSVMTGMIEGFRWLWHNRVIRVLSLQATIGNFGFGMVMAVFLYYLRSTLGLDARLVGADYAMLEVGGLLGTLAIVPLERRFRRGTLYSGIIVWGMVGLAMTATLRSWWWGPGVGMAVLLSCNLAWIIITTSVRQEQIPADLRGRVLSFSRVLSTASMPLGATLGGLITQRFDPVVVFMVAIATKVVELLITRFSSMRKL
jgi:MFS family permease